MPHHDASITRRTAIQGLASAALGAPAPGAAARDETGLGRWLARFKEAPREYTLIPFWFWNDDLDEREIRRQIEDFVAHGVYGFVIHPRIGLPESIDFMSERYLHFVRLAVEQAARLGMIVHLYDEAMYPSGSGGGLVVQENPRFAARCLIRRTLTDADSPALARNETLVTVNGRTALIDAPSGGRIRGIHYDARDHEPPGPLAADLLNPEATASFIRHVHEGYYRAVGSHFGKTVRAIFTDEPSLLGRGPRRDSRPWTTGLEVILQGRLGYDVRPRLAELWEDRRPDSAAFRLSVARAINERLEETYYAPLSRWCSERRIALTGHPAGPGDIGVLRYFQIPGQDIVWRFIEPGKPSAVEGEQSVTAKCSASAKAHLRRARNGNEAFGAYGWNLTFDEMKWLTNWLMLRGVDLIFPHAFYYSLRGPRRDERPPDVGPNNRWWAEFRPYAEGVRRLCWLNAAHRPVLDAAILGWSDSLPWRAARVCLENQIDYHYLEARHLLDGSARATAKGIEIAGFRYACLILDGGDALPDTLARALRPLDSAGRLIRHANAAAPAPLLRRLRSLSNPALSVARPEPGLRARCVTDGRLRAYLLFNEGESPINNEITLAQGFAPRLAIHPYRLEQRTLMPERPVEVALSPHDTIVILASCDKHGVRESRSKQG